MNLLSVEPIQLLSHRFIRYKAQYRSQHQDQSQGDKSVSNSTVESPKVDSKNDQNKGNGSEVTQNETQDKPSLYQRFKQTYKQHGKIFIAVHLVTSAAWFSSFYLAVKSGIDIVPYLEKWNFSEKVINPFRSDGKLGALAITLLMYKLAAPARYAVTLGATNVVIKYLRKEGKMKEIPQEDRLRSLYQEGKENLKTKSRVRIKKFRRKAKLGKGSKQDNS
ncbi:hypothetical protein Btru_019688 [Bulinus truncatus]|nr:hypothetical protein Btru_019688 [Bulinus truncatus]